MSRFHLVLLHEPKLGPFREPAMPATPAMPAMLEPTRPPNAVRRRASCVFTRTYATTPSGASPARFVCLTQGRLRHLNHRGLRVGSGVFDLLDAASGMLVMYLRGKAACVNGGGQCHICLIQATLAVRGLA